MGGLLARVAIFLPWGLSLLERDWSLFGDTLACFPPVLYPEFPPAVEDLRTLFALWWVLWVGGLRSVIECWTTKEGVGYVWASGVNPSPMWCCWFPFWILEFEFASLYIYWESCYNYCLVCYLKEPRVREPPPALLRGLFTDWTFGI